MSQVPLDQRLAGILVRPLANTGITPNQVTAFSLILSLAGDGLFAWGGGAAVHWGAGVFLVSRFIDHMDGELARLTGKTSRFGYFFDGIVGVIAYAALFICMGVGLWRGGGEFWVLILPVVAGIAIAMNAVLQFRMEATLENPPATYPSWGPFELEDGVYLIGPIVWLGFLYPLFLVGCFGTIAFLTIRTAQAVFRVR
jgi:phosphatidylglycerophosphate synthase